MNINLFTWPSATRGRETNLTRNGYQMENRFGKWDDFLGRVNESELRECGSLYMNQHQPSGDSEIQK